jgi:DNA-binding transcriptional ArsR family regulator
MRWPLVIGSILSTGLFDDDRTELFDCLRTIERAGTIACMTTTTTTQPAALPEPRPSDMRIEAVLGALSDPVRLSIVRTLAASEGESRACGSFGLTVSKSTASHHFRVLREAGVIRQRDEGRHRMTELRRADLDARFPGLLGSVIAAGQVGSPQP